MAVPARVALLALLCWSAAGGEGATGAPRAGLVQRLDVTTTPGDTIVALCAGDSHLSFLTRAGAVLTVGSNRYGQLGRSRGETEGADHAVASTSVTLDARAIELPGSAQPAPASAFACGPLNTAFISSLAVFSCGDNSHEQLGRATDASLMDRYPRPIELPPGARALRFVLVAVSESLGVAATAAGQVFVWGGADEDEPADTPADEWLPRLAELRLAHGETIVELAAGLGHLAVRTSAGRLLTAGQNDLGQLGRSQPDDESLDELRPLAAPFGAERFGAVGSTELHCVALTADGSVLTWGDNDSLQLGRQMDEREDADGWAQTPGAVELGGLLDGAGGEEVVAVAAGKLHTVVLTSAGRLIGWGSNSDGQLGLAAEAAAAEAARRGGAAPHAARRVAVRGGGVAGARRAARGRPEGDVDDDEGAVADGFDGHAEDGDDDDDGDDDGDGDDGDGDGAFGDDEGGAPNELDGFDGEEGYADEDDEDDDDDDEEDADADLHLIELPTLLPLQAPSRAPSQLHDEARVVQVHAAATLTLLLLSDGRVLALGDVVAAILEGDHAGSAAEPHAVAMPAAVDESENVVALGAGAHHSLALTAHGQLLGWGDNAAGALGQPRATPRSEVPLLVPAGCARLRAAEHGVLLLASATRSALVTDLGRVFLWGGVEPSAPAAGAGADGAGATGGGDGEPRAAADGDGADGGCAHDGTERGEGRELALGLLAEGEGVVRGALSARVLLLVTTRGRLLRVQFRRARLPLLTALAWAAGAAADSRVASVACSDGRDGGHGGHCVAVLRGGALALWGSSGRGQLGASAARADAPAEIGAHAPIRLALPAGARAFGACACAEATVVLDGDGRVWTWGGNIALELGRATGGAARADARPSRVLLPLGDGESVTQLACGASHVLALTTGGRGLSWGSNSHRQLGHSSAADGASGTSASDPADAALALLPGPIVLADLLERESLAQLSAAAEHSLALTSFGYVFAFGNCRAGQCGLAAGEPAPGAPAASTHERAEAADAPPSHGVQRGPPRPARLPPQTRAPPPSPTLPAELASAVEVDGQADAELGGVHVGTDDDDDPPALVDPD